jgi:hypothetical protein
VKRSKKIKIMKRRDSLKTMLIGAMAGTTLTTAVSCETDEVAAVSNELGLYGRTNEEIKRDSQLMSDTYLTADELGMVAVLCDIILPATPKAVSATGAGVDDFIEFIVKDLPYHQLPIRGGLMWLNGESRKRFDKVFVDLTNTQQIKIIDDIAYPDPENKKPEMAYGIQFFDLMRKLTLTGYYTSKEGIKELGYVGNRPNVWDGVPQDVLDKHGMSYDADWLAKCVDQSKSHIKAEWDEAGNLLT